MRSGTSLSAFLMPSGPLLAEMTSKYSADSLASNTRTLGAKSSTTRMRAVIGLFACLLQAYSVRNSSIVAKKLVTEIGLAI